MFLAGIRKLKYEESLCMTLSRIGVGVLRIVSRAFVASSPKLVYSINNALRLLRIQVLAIAVE